MSHKVSLSTEQTYILADKMQQYQDKKRSKRLLAISLRHFGYKIKDISLITGVSDKTVTTWIKLFLNGGFDELLALNYPHTESSRLAPYKEKIRSFRIAHPEARLEDLQTWLRDVHGIEVEYSWLYRYVTKYKL